MTLALILQAKGRDVVTASPHQTLRETAETLDRRNIGAIIVVDAEEKVCGIVSERDIIRAVARNKLTVLDDPVSDHMTSRVETATEETSVLEAMERMTAGRFRHLPVTKGNRLKGVVSIGDLVKYRISEMEHENKAMLEYITTV
ncbi:CBS domain-containing protein [Lichenifustis flavocetrariae]|uniref:CBS domain-containing protein n=1 Tax=Lichenifustis flavocetrariae TaxID=2949735 RepID=A0AA41YY06_9HYPH|nr:CBS domain-containing protein [Lichenifustis flavocetrariae]MCW6509118.1 CBS domain-containing protein [Lichenifustis flavocetrariae]